MGLSREKAIKKILDNINKSEATLIQMDTSGYPEPEKFSFQGGYNNKKYTPDAVVYYDNELNLFAIESSTSKKHLAEALHKWILFSTLTKKKNGTFYLVVEKEKMEAFQKIISSKQIAAEILEV